MIRVLDAATLAATKLRTRKVRLTATVVIAGLLFGVLAAASFLARGAFDSLAGFSQEGYGSRYIVQAAPISGPLTSGPMMNSFSDPVLIDRALAIAKDQTIAKTAEAKRLGLPYNAADEPSPIDEIDVPDGKVRSLNKDHFAAKQALDEHAKKNPTPDGKVLREVAKAYHPKQLYSSLSQPYGAGASALQLLKDGKENYDQSQYDQPMNFGVPPTGIDSFATGWGLASQDLITPFSLPGARFDIGADGSIPVAAPYSAVVQMLKLKALPDNADTKTKLDRIAEVRSKASTITFQACYRNQASAEQLQETITTRQEVARNAKNKDFVKPTLLYKLPAKPCAEPVIDYDKRTAEEKQLAAKRLQFDRKFGAGIPAQEVVTFRVAGILPDPAYNYTSVSSSIISSIVSSNLSSLPSTWLTPHELIARKPLLNNIFQDDVNAALSTEFVEFHTAADATKFLDETNCSPDFGAMPENQSDYDPYADCTKAGRPFMLNAFGSNSLALEDVKQGFNKVFAIAALVVAGLASLIMVGTVGRTVADSRRETAVFRAIGAKRLDIAGIYLVYTSYIALLLFCFAVVAGLIAALIINLRYSDDLTYQALLAYNASDLTRTFSLFAVNASDMLRLFALCIAGGALSAVLPLLRNIRRNPIRDMRDDT